MAHSDNIDPKIVLIGGNGFVGCEVAQRLVSHQITPVCVSRSGTKPAHLTSSSWASAVIWHKSDAVNLDAEILVGADALVCLVGSPPIPTFSHAGYRKQLYMNSEPNIAAIQTAITAGVKRLVLLGAHLPSALNTDKFAYAKGKRLCLEAAKSFSTISDQHSAVAIQPTAIYGKRHLANGRPINIGAAMKPIANLQGMMPKFAKEKLPEQFVSVDAVANTIVRACLDNVYEGVFTLISNQQILQDSGA